MMPSGLAGSSLHFALGLNVEGRALESETTTGDKVAYNSPLAWPSAWLIQPSSFNLPPYFTTMVPFMMIQWPGKVQR